MKKTISSPPVQLRRGILVQSAILFYLFLSPAILYSQIDLTRYYNPRIPLVVMDDYLTIEFSWNMGGNMQALINEGINSLDEGKPAYALTNLNQAIKIDSTLWMSRYYRGICYKQVGLLDSSEYDLKAAIRLNPSQPQPYIELAENYIATNRLQKAIRTLDLAIEKDPMLPQGYYNLAAIAVLEGNLNKAKKYYKKANEVGPQYPDAYLMQGLITAYKQSPWEALSLISKAVEVDPSYSTGYFWRGLLLLQQNDIEACLRDWDNLVRYNPGNAMYAVMRGYLYIELKQFDAAFIDLKNALRAQEVDENKFSAKQTILDKQIDLHAVAKYLMANGYGLDETAFAVLKKAFCLLLINDKKGALESLSHAENIQPSATVYFLKATAFEHAGMHHEAMEYYTRALKRDNDIFDAHKKRSIYRLELKDWAGAQEDLDNMFRLDRHSPVAYRLSGLVKAHKQDYAEAINDLSKFIATDTTDTEIYQTRITCNTMLGNRDAAHSDIGILLRRNPKNWSLCYEMAMNYLTLKDTVEALSILQAFSHLSPGLFQPYKKMAEIYVLNKDPKQASWMVEKAKSLLVEMYSPLDFSDFYLLEGMIAYYNQDFKTAISKFNKSLKLNNKNWDAQYYRAKAFVLAGQPKKALKDYEFLAGNKYKDSLEIYQALLPK